MRSRSSRPVLIPAFLLVTTLCAGSLVAQTQPGTWILPDRQIGRHTAPLLVLSRPEVQAELKLDPKSVSDLTRAIAEIHGKALALRGRRDPEAIAARRAIDEAQQTWLQSRLTEEQRTRLAQLDLQWEGPSALHTRPTVADSLRLTETQRQKLGAAVVDREKKRAIPERDSRADDMALANAVLASLHDEQKTRWKSMLGVPCVFKIEGEVKAASAEAPAAAPVAPAPAGGTAPR